MIRVLYITNVKLTLHRAHVFNILKTAEALNRVSGIAVEVLSREGRWASLRLTREIRARQKNFEVLYFRDPKLFFPAFAARFFLGKKVIFEIHGSHEWRYLACLWRLSFRISSGAVFITAALKNWYRPGRKPWIVVHVNAPDLNRLEAARKEKPNLRKKLGLPEDKVILLYVGNAMWYAIDVLVKMMQFLPEECFLALVGLKDGEAKEMTELARLMGVEGKVFISGRFRPEEEPRWAIAADILLNPLKINYPGSVSSKLFEYLAAGRPIISSDGEANREILKNGENAVLVSELTAGRFAEAVKKVLTDRKFAALISERALEDSKQYTWEGRARAIAELIQKVAAQK